MDVQKFIDTDDLTDTLRELREAGLPSMDLVIISSAFHELMSVRKELPELRKSQNHLKMLIEKGHKAFRRRSWKNPHQFIQITTGKIEKIFTTVIGSTYVLTVDDILADDWEAYA